jgi:hypothetical protein
MVELFHGKMEIGGIQYGLQYANTAESIDARGRKRK